MTRIVIWLVCWLVGSIAPPTTAQRKTVPHVIIRTAPTTKHVGKVIEEQSINSSGLPLRFQFVSRPWIGLIPTNCASGARCHPLPPQRSSPAKVSNFCSLFHISLDSKNAHRRKSGLEPVGWLFHGGVCSGFLVKLRWHGEPERSWSWRKWKWDLPSPMRSGSRWSALLSAGATSRPGRLR